MIRIAIVGLGHVGKSTLFQILTRAHGAPSGSKSDTHVGVVAVPDTRLDRLSAMYSPKKTVHASIEYLDAPGSVIDLLRTGSRAAASVKEVDALAHVVRAFHNDAVPAPSGEVNPKADVETTDLELMLSDLAVIEKRLERLAKDVKKLKNPALEKELQVVERCKNELERQIPLRQVDFTPEELKLIRGFTFLSLKPMVYVLNLDEADAARAEAADQFADEMGLARKPRTAVTAVCGKVESELAELPEAEAIEFMESYGLKESAVARFIRTGYRLLDLISFFTVGEDECRAWTIRAGSTALDAAGEIHSDIQKGFIRAEVVSYDDLVSDGSLAEARAKAHLKLEGKEYVVHDGEVVHFRHSG